MQVSGFIWQHSLFHVTVISQITEDNSEVCRISIEKIYIVARTKLGIWILYQSENAGRVGSKSDFTCLKFHATYVQDHLTFLYILKRLQKGVYNDCVVG